MTVETEMMNEENGRLRRHIKTLEAELKKQDAAQAQATDCGCIGPRDCTGACRKKAAVEPDWNHPDDSVEPVINTQIEAAYEAGWVEAACWAKRDDLIADIGSPAYLDDRMAHLDSIYAPVVEPFAWVTKIGILLPPYEPMSDDVPLYTSPPDHREAMRLALEALNNSVDTVWEEYTEAERNYGNYPTRRAKLDGMKAMAQQHDAAIAALKGQLK